MAVAVAVSAGACSSAGTYAARVAGKTISEDSLIDELRAIGSNAPYLETLKQPVLGSGEGTFDATFTAAVLTRRIYFELIGMELAQRKLVVTQEHLAEAREAVLAQVGGENILTAFPADFQTDLVVRQAQIDLLALASSGLGTPETAERDYYEQHPEEFQSACASVIRVADEAKALDLRKRLAEGADFAELAKAESTDTTSGAEGGVIGCDIRRSSEGPTAIIDAVFTQPVGEVGAPVGTPSGFHLIKVTSREVASFEVSRERIRATLVKIGAENILVLLTAKVRDSNVDVNPKYGTFDKAAERPGVVPPQGGSPTTAPPSGTPTAP